MKQLIAIFAILLLSFNISGQEISKAYKATTVTFLGLDYTGAVFIGTAGFKDPAALQFLPDSWNSLLLSEPDKYNVQSAFQLRLHYNLDVVKERNNQVNYGSRIISKQLSLPHLSKDDLQAMIDNYPDIEEDEVALVFIVDAYDKAGPTGYYHVVFFDTKSKQILLTYVVTGEAGGGGLRNYWANSFYDTLKKAGTRYSSTAEFYRDYTK